MKKGWKKKAALAAILVLVFAAGCLWYINDYYKSDVTMQQYFQDDSIVAMEETEYGLYMDGPGNESALIFYPGAKVEYTAYVPLLYQLAEKGVDIFLIKMPCNLAFFGQNKADDVIKKYEYEKWYLGGHSLGGAMAAYYAAEHPDDLEGLIFLAAYSTKDLQEDDFSVISLYGSEDGVLNMDKMEESRAYMPANYTEICIEGGNHAQFGDYGEQKGDGTASISRQEQQNQTVEAVTKMIMEDDAEDDLINEDDEHNEDNEVIYPVSENIIKEEVANGYTFFTYGTSEKVGDAIITYPVLYKWKKDGAAERVSEYACPHFEVVNNNVIYLNSSIMDFSHGRLYLSDGKNEKMLEEEVYDFTIDGGYIYYSYCFDTTGVGLDGHALHRMDLDGNNVVTVAYELSGPDLKGNHFDVVVKDGWAIYDNYKIEIEHPADGLEKVVLLENIDAEWIYYTSNRLIKAKPDGSELVILDDKDDFWYKIDAIDEHWIYYQKGNDSYKIDINGNNKTKIEGN